MPAPGDYDDGEIGGMIGRGNRSTRRKPAPVPLWPPQTPHAARMRTRAAAVGSQQLTAWATARPKPDITQDRILYLVTPEAWTKWWNTISVSSDAMCTVQLKRRWMNNHTSDILRVSTGNSCVRDLILKVRLLIVSLAGMARGLDLSIVPCVYCMVHNSAHVKVTCGCAPRVVCPTFHQSQWCTGQIKY
jgi:hypothetical protein